MRIKVELDKEGNIYLYTRINGESKYKLEGKKKIDVLPQSEWFGMVCYYSKTRNKNLHFDNFIVKELVESKPEEPEIPDEEKNDNDKEEEEKEKDPSIPRKGEILFSEIMADPVGHAYLYPEYIELYNHSDRTFDLSKCTFYYGGKPYSLNGGIIQPRSYLIICHEEKITDFGAGIDIATISNFPQLANTGKLVMLKNKNGELISWFEYSDNMHGNPEKKKGWSLECIDLENLSNTAQNWAASNDPTGGSPGKTNSINAHNPDIIMPKITSLRQNDEKLHLIFSKYMDEQTILEPSSYSLIPSEYNINAIQTNSPKCNELTLTLDKVLPEGEFIEMNLSGVRDCSGNKLEPEDIIVGHAGYPEYEEVIISELLFNPPSGGNEYVEIYNLSEKIIDLRYISITSRKPSDGSFNKLYPVSTLPLFLYPEEYLVITKRSDAVCAYFPCREEGYFVELPIMPPIANASGCVVLVNNQSDEVIDEFAYSEKMHSSDVKNKKGVALEKINLMRPSSELSNWQSAGKTSGSGSPGYDNSKDNGNDKNPDTDPSDNPNDSHSDISITYPSPANDNYEIRYSFSQSGCYVKMYLYDSQGRLIIQLVDNEALSQEGTITWDGKGENNKELGRGIYILYTEVLCGNSESKKTKMPVVVK